MPRKHYSTEQIIMILRQVEIKVGQGSTVEEALRDVGITGNTYYRWRKEYGTMTASKARELKALEKENVRLKKLVADLSLDNAILKDVASKNF
jgi:transposase-like protein